LPKQLLDEVAAADVVDQIAEFDAAERIVAEILDYRTAIGVAVRFGELFFRQIWKSPQKKRAKVTGPHQIDNFFVREHGVGEQTGCAQERRQQESHDANRQQAATAEISLSGGLRISLIF
jgi:hypothetical protein